ncbi:FKBP-type peptidyl-prolyl cis-trans isomerase [Glutamicibacter sp.]|uniref:FKBP-type peptidyl-prolyl cis-trans isomerase n=1 Tax=Glutamicibacter sp. TaxID=1931995 RepID=UPI0028BF3E13|nr:FKBP-type peptidyl-prolyl cis-trans isomerase [Glutamicibacter sp.]
MRKVMAAAATASILALAACGSTSGSSSLSDIKVTPGKDASSAPEVSFDTPFLTEKDEAVNVVKGDGAEVNPGDTIKVKSGLYKTIDGKLTNENFTGAATDMTLDDQFKQSMPELYDVLINSKVGDWVAYSAIEGTQQANGTTSTPEAGTRAERIILIDIEDTTPVSSKLSDDEVAKLKKEGKLPTVSFKDKQPTISIPKDTEAPNGLVVDVLEEGKGTEATADSKVTAKYLGVTYADGKKFDGNFDKEPTTFSLNQVIKGWTQGMTGLKEGSKVMLTIPADLAYGNTSQQGSPTGTLVFYVELTNVEAPASK